MNIIVLSAHMIFSFRSLHGEINIPFPPRYDFKLQIRLTVNGHDILALMPLRNSRLPRQSQSRGVLQYFDLW